MNETTLASWLIANYNYFSTPAVMLTIIGATWLISSKISIFKAEFAVTAKKVDKIESVVSRLNHCMIEIQTFLKTKFEGTTFMEVINMYGESNSPMVLKKEFKPFIEKSGIESQIKEKKEILVDYIKKRKPATGLDAQRAIAELVASDKIEEFLDTTELKKILYEQGKTTRDYYAILSIYLFETIIPEVIGD